VGFVLENEPPGRGVFVCLMVLCRFVRENGVEVGFGSIIWEGTAESGRGPALESG